MPVINFIPERYEYGFKRLSSLGEKQFNDLKEGLNLTALTSSLSALAEKIAEIKKLKVDDLLEIFRSVGSLLPLLEKKEVIEEIIEDIAKVGFEKKIVKDKVVFAERLRFLFNSTQIYHASKANELSSEYKNIYLTSRITSDIRVVFSDDIEQAPKGAMITHNLHIHYRADHEGDHKDIYIALESDDIKTLKDALIRAEIKEKNLQKILGKANLTNLKE